MALLGLDIGTTHCKAALFTLEGSVLSTAIRATPLDSTGDGRPYHPAERLWVVVLDAISEALCDSKGEPVDVIGIASMAEAGLLVDIATGSPRTEVLPWFDRSAAAESEEIRDREGAAALFFSTGLHSSYKFGLPKLLWLRRQDPMLLGGAVWLSVADYIAYRLTGRRATSPGLAARTYLLDVRHGDWDRSRLECYGLPFELLPDILPAGAIVGYVSSTVAADCRLSEGIPVSIAGHDHVCALVGAGIHDSGESLDSMGTAESLLGVLAHFDLRDAEFESGLAFVPHVVPGRWCWLGGISSSGGALDWLRSRLSEPPLTYAELAATVAERPPSPSGIAYFPYLSGSGAPEPDQHARAGFIGLSSEHTRGDIVRSVLEGISFEAESIWRTVDGVSGGRIDDIMVVGGGSRFADWIQVKADVSGRRHMSLPGSAGVTLLGAALTAGVGAGRIPGWRAAQGIARMRNKEGDTFVPNPARHHEYRRIYESVYLPLQGPLRKASHQLQAIQ